MVDLPTPDMDPLDEFVPDLSPDGRHLAYHSWRTKSRDIFVQPLDGGPLEQVTATSSQEAFPVWSPDGQSLAFVDLSEDRGLFRGAFVTRRDETGRWSAPVALRVGAWKVSWSPDGRFLAYSRGDAVEVVSPDSRASRVVMCRQHIRQSPRPKTCCLERTARPCTSRAMMPKGAHLSGRSLSPAGHRACLSSSRIPPGAPAGLTSQSEEGAVSSPSTSAVATSGLLT